MEGTILLELERAELAARERRLRAEGEAEEELARAREQAAETASGVERAIGEAIEARRQTLDAEAEGEIEALGRELAELEGEPGADRERAAVRRAVELVVASVLAEG
jgi:phage-related tail protein